MGMHSRWSQSSGKMGNEVTGVGIIPTEGRTESTGTDDVIWREILEQGVSVSSPRAHWHERDEREENSLKEHWRKQGKPRESSYGSQNRIVSGRKECSTPQRETCQMRARCISGILFPWNKTSLNSIRATHNRGNILFEIRSIFGRCISGRMVE